MSKCRMIKVPDEQVPDDVVPDEQVPDEQSAEWASAGWADLWRKLCPFLTCISGMFKQWKRSSDGLVHRPIVIR